MEEPQNKKRKRKLNAHTLKYHYLEEGLFTYMYDSSLTDHYCLLTGNVGSVVHVVNGEGGTMFDAGYDAWGKQVVTNNVIGFHRGYGGHEMLPQYRLVNMHTFRHTDELQLNRDLIKNIITSDILQIGNIPQGLPINRTVNVNGCKLQYTVYKLDNGTLNVGRIHGVK